MEGAFVKARDAAELRITESAHLVELRPAENRIHVKSRFGEAGARREGGQASPGGCPYPARVAEKRLAGEDKPTEVGLIFKNKATEIDHRRLHPSQRSGVGTHGFGGYEIVVLAAFLGDKPAGCLQSAAPFEHSLRPGVPNRPGRFVRLLLGFAFRERRGACALAPLPKRNRLIPCHPPLPTITCLKIPGLHYGQACRSPRAERRVSR